MPRLAWGSRAARVPSVRVSLTRLSTTSPTSWPSAASMRVRSATCRNRPPTGARITCRMRSLEPATGLEPAFKDDYGVARIDRGVELDRTLDHFVALAAI